MAVRMTLDNFVECEANRAALRAMTAFIDGQGKALSPLGLVGPDSCGKTHLLAAAASWLSEHRRGANCLFLTGDRYVTECVAAAEGGLAGVGRLHARFRDLHALFIDDLEDVALQEQAGLSMRRLLEASRDGGPLIAYSLGAELNETAISDTGLRSLLLSGTTVALEAPGLEAIRAMLKQWSDEIGVDEVAFGPVLDAIGGRAYPTLRDYKGALLRVIAYSAITAQRPNEGMVIRVLGPA